MKGMMKVKLVIALLVVIAVAIFYYVSLPAINIHATETWKFIFLILAVLFVLYIVRKAKIAGQSKIELSFIKEYTGLKIGVIVFLLFLAVYCVRHQLFQCKTFHRASSLSVEFICSISYCFI